MKFVVCMSFGLCALLSDKLGYSSEIQGKVDSENTFPIRDTIVKSTPAPNVKTDGDVSESSKNEKVPQFDSKTDAEIPLIPKDENHPANRTPNAYCGIETINGKFYPTTNVSLSFLLTMFKSDLQARNGHPIGFSPRESENKEEIKVMEYYNSKVKRAKICLADQYYDCYDGTCITETNVVNAQSCQAYCESKSHALPITYMSFGGTLGPTKGLCHCHLTYPRLLGRESTHLQDTGAASYPITLPGTFISSTDHDTSFYAQSVTQCRTGCLFSAWYNSEKNAIFSFQGCYVEDSEPVTQPPKNSKKCGHGQFNAPNYDYIKAPSLPNNCHCHFDVKYKKTENRQGSESGPAAPCGFIIQV